MPRFIENILIVINLKDNKQEILPLEELIIFHLSNDKAVIKCNDKVYYPTDKYSDLINIRKLYKREAYEHNRTKK